MRDFGGQDAPTNINKYSEPLIPNVPADVSNIPNKERPAEIPRLVILACRGHNVPEPPAAFVPLLPAVEAACKACVVPKLCAVQPV